jgi:hypothetical protein
MKSLSANKILALAFLFLIEFCSARAPLAAAELEATFRGVKARLVAELRSAKPDIREASLRKFLEFPVPEAAEALLTQRKLTKFPDVRSGSFEVLRSYANSESVGQVLFEDLLRHLKTGKIDSETGVRLLVLVSGENARVRALAKAALAEIEKSREGSKLLITVVDELADLEDRPSALALLRLEEEPVIDSHAGLKRALVQALCKIEDKDAVTRLVQRLVTAEGETRADILRRMHQISGLAPDARPEWPAWWQEKQEKFEFPPAAAAKPDPFLRAALGAAPGAVVPSYYGLPLYGSRIVFVVDFSGSMAGAKVEAAKRELRNAIGLLPDATRFNVISFNSEVLTWKKELVAVSPITKKEASVWVASGAAIAKTHSYDALAAALAQDCDAIYFLTDGAPTGGKVTNPPQIVEAISRLNRVRRATINTLGISPGQEGGAFDDFLHDLAEQNFGVYKRLD